MKNTMPQNLSQKRRFIDDILLYTIGIFCLLYSIFLSKFAELHLNFSFLNFPVFIGEFLLAFCLLLVMIKYADGAFAIYKSHYLLFAYILWIAAKAWQGYVTYGPLSFRNAALFYYPLFVFIGADCFYRGFFRGKINISLFFLLGVPVAAKLFQEYYQYAYLSLLISISRLLNKKWVFYAALGLVVLYVAQHKFLFLGSRSHIVGSIMAISFFIYFLLRLKTEFKWPRVGVVTLLVLLVLNGLFHSADKNAVKSMFCPEEFFRCYRDAEAIIDQRKKDFTFGNLPVNLYNPDTRNFVRAIPLFSELMQETLRDYRRILIPMAAASVDKYQKRITQMTNEVISRQGARGSPEEMNEIRGICEVILKESQDSVHKYERRLSQKITDMVGEYERRLLKNTAGIDKGKDSLRDETLIAQEEEKSVREFRVALSRRNKELQALISRLSPVASAYNSPQGDFFAEYGSLSAEEKEQLFNESKQRSLDVAFSNTLFRLLIWRDMLAELWDGKAVFGINFGKPQRSRSVEIIGWAQEEWIRDGWITPHNSFLHIIYRGGIIGIFLIVYIFWTIARLTRIFLDQKSWVGGLLTAALVYWLTIANFLVFLELPYYAIPFWCFFGMVWGYARSLTNADQEGKYESTTS